MDALPEDLSRQVFTHASWTERLLTFNALAVADMVLIGFVGAAGRGSVSGSGITGRDTSYRYTVGFANTNAQYWTDAATSSGSFATRAVAYARQSPKLRRVG